MYALRSYVQACSGRLLVPHSKKLSRKVDFRTTSTTSHGLESSEEEIERKFVVTEAILKAVLSKSHDQAPELKMMTDIYFDDKSYNLTTRDMWLRKRNAVFELKWPQQREDVVCDEEKDLQGIDFYMESTSWITISEVLNNASVWLQPPLPADNSPNSVDLWLNGNQLYSFANIKSVRQRYKFELPSGRNLSSEDGSKLQSHLIHVDVDQVEYIMDDKDTAKVLDSYGLKYTIGEIELIRAAEGYTKSQAMTDIFTQLGIKTDPVRGKVLEYLSRFKPEHYKALELSGLIGKKMQ